MNGERDRERFAAAITITSEVLGADLSPAKVEGYFQALQDLPIEGVLAGLAEARRSSRFFPKPAEIRELSVGADEGRAAIAWATAMKLARRARLGQRVDLGDAAAHTAIEMLGGWRHVWILGRPEVPDIEIQNVKRDFTPLYLLALRNQNLLATAPAVLVDEEEKRRGLIVGPILKAKPTLGAGTTGPAVLPASAQSPELPG
jgi:hypothetical protein